MVQHPDRRSINLSTYLHIETTPQNPSLHGNWEALHRKQCVPLRELRPCNTADNLTTETACRQKRHRSSSISWWISRYLVACSYLKFTTLTPPIQHHRWHWHFWVLLSKLMRSDMAFFLLLKNVWLLMNTYSTVNLFVKYCCASAAAVHAALHIRLQKYVRKVKGNASESAMTIYASHWVYMNQKRDIFM